MTTTATRAPAPAAPITGRTNVRLSGIFYLITFAASIPAALLLDPILTDSAFIQGAGSATPVLWGNVLDVVNAAACIGTAVAIFPVLRRHHESLALGFVTSRLLEAAIIMIGVASLLAVVTLRESGAAGPATGEALVAIHAGAFLLGPGTVPAVNALLFGTLLFRARLVPRIIPALGLLGAPLLLASATATLFDEIEQSSPTALLAALPIAAWELTIGIWMTTRGFREPTT